MRFASIRKYDVANGPGIRTSVFFTGCTHACRGCFNALYQDFNFGEVWTDDHTATVLEYLNSPEVAGLTLLGGEPLQQPREILLPLLERVKDNMPAGKTIWIYSGYHWDEIVADDALKTIAKFADVLIDGRFEIAQKNLKLRFRGSSNQRILDVKKSLERGAAILYNLGSP